MGPPESVSESMRTAAPALAVLVLFGVVVASAGVWPPFVAVESGSMEPNLERGDLVLLTATERFAPATATDAGVVTLRRASGYHRLGKRGDVVVFDPPSRAASPVIHRARLHVERGENWYAEADSGAIPASVDSCAELRHCPAPHAGYITKGDANDNYDQAVGRFTVVRDGWHQGKAQLAVPWVGHLRLLIKGA